MIQKIERKKGFSYKVRWWQFDGSERTKTFRTKAAARHFERENALTQNAGTYVDPLRSRVAASGVWSGYIESQEGLLKPKSMAGYQYEWERRIQPRWGNVRVDRITNEDIATWVLDMGQIVGASSVRYAYRCLSLMLDYAVRIGRLTKNPAKGVPLPALETKPHIYLSVPEIEWLSELCTEAAEVYGDMIRAGAYLGLRAGEAVGLRVSDVDLKSRRLRIRRNVTAVKGILVEGTPKSKASARTVPIPEAIVPMLERRIDGKELGDLVFSAPTNSRAYVRLENMRRATQWKSITSAMGLEGVTFHSLRHSYASLARKAGADLRAIQKSMGHASITTTARVYADLFDDELTTIAQSLDRIIIDFEENPVRLLSARQPLSARRRRMVQGETAPRIRKGIKARARR